MHCLSSLTGWEVEYKIGKDSGEKKFSFDCSVVLKRESHCLEVEERVA
jgi:hypothetical protein